MATDTRNNRDLVNSLNRVSTELSKMNRTLASINTNLVQIGRIYKENTGTTVDSFDEEETPPNA